MGKGLRSSWLPGGLAEGRFWTGEQAAVTSKATGTGTGQDPPEAGGGGTEVVGMGNSGRGGIGMKGVASGTNFTSYHLTPASTSTVCGLLGAF